MTGVAHQKVNAGHLKRTLIFTSANPRFAKSSKIPKAPNGSTGCANMLLPWAGPWSASSSSTAISDSPVHRLSIGRAFRNWFRKWAWAKPASCSVWKFPGWREIPPIGIDCLEICALTDTLILDEDGVYDPAHFNDRLLLGLKGTMSEAELHVLRARLQGGILNKARRGELQCPLPVGFVYNANNEPVLDPDKQVQESIRFFFETFRRTASACAVVKAFRQKGLLFPRRLKKGPNKGDLVWAELPHSRALHILHNPRYTGAFVYGRSRTRNNPNGGASYTRLPRRAVDATQECSPRLHLVGAV